MPYPKIAIVGAGNQSAKRIYPNVAAANGQIVAICDLDLENSERITFKSMDEHSPT